MGTAVYGRRRGPRPEIFSAGFAGGRRSLPRHAAMVAHQVQDDSSRHELDALWRATQDRLRASVPESTFRLWLEPLRAVGADADTLYLTGPEGIRAWAERRYSSLIGQALAGAGTPLRRVSFNADAESQTGATAAIDGAELNPNYTFERFVIGSG